MRELALLIDFGSTYTKVIAIDLAEARVVGRAQAPSTVATDVCEGLLDALLRLETMGCMALAGRPRNIDALLAGTFVRASSSAAGGLRMVVVGLVPGLTVQAANAAALGAGGKIVGAFGFRLDAENVAEIVRLQPDIILLTGGTEGGDTRTIIHNASALAHSDLAVPFVVAGNSEANAQINSILGAEGKKFTIAANVMPRSKVLQPEPAQEEIRRVFLREIVRGKGLARIEPHVPVVLATPMAVLAAALLGSQGIAGQGGCGDLLLVDIGGATTDVYSIGAGRHNGRDVIPKELPETFAKRTVEGDLGIRSNAATIVKRIGEEEFFARFCGLFPEENIDRSLLSAYVQSLSRETERIPQMPWQVAADAALAHVAADIAIERHVGTREPYYAREGAVFVQNGKDLRDAPILIGTGGVFQHNLHAARILIAGTQRSGHREILRPTNPQSLLDKNYILYAVGLLSESHPEVALRLFQRHLRPPIRTFSAPAIAEHDSFCACCSDFGLSYSENRTRPQRPTHFRAESD
jgi:uncharacterized protein (TIGR01319 family)